MKVIISDSVKNRIKFAAINGSAVAKKLEEIFKSIRNKDASEVFGDKKCNYFDTVKIKSEKSFRVEFSCCMKDLTNPNFPDAGNPDAPWFKENRSKLTPTNFAKLFFTDEEAEAFTTNDYNYFQSAICLQSRVVLKISSAMKDIEEAYFEGNYVSEYQSGDSECRTLHNSCMRYEEKARNAADFYSHVAGTRIIYAKDEQGNVLARALVWDNVKMVRDGEEQYASFVERTYISYWFLLPLIRQFAIDNGIQYCKTYNTFDTQKYFTSIAETTWNNVVYPAETQFEFAATKDIPVRGWHKFGCPYTDTMSNICYDTVRGLYLSNTRYGNCVAILQHTYGCASPCGYICPVCGKVHSDSGLCPECLSELREQSVFGAVFTGTVRKWKGVSLPSKVFNGNTPNKHTQSWIGLQRIFCSSAEEVKSVLR